MDLARSRQILFACASGLLLPLCFPKFDLGLLAWIVLIPSISHSINVPNGEPFGSAG